MAEYWRRILKECRSNDPDCSTCSQARRELAKLTPETVSMPSDDPYFEVGGSG